MPCASTAPGTARVITSLGKGYAVSTSPMVSVWGRPTAWLGSEVMATSAPVACICAKFARCATGLAESARATLSCTAGAGAARLPAGCASHAWASARTPCIWASKKGSGGVVAVMCAARKIRTALILGVLSIFSVGCPLGITACIWRLVWCCCCILLGVCQQLFNPCCCGCAAVSACFCRAAVCTTSSSIAICSDAYFCALAGSCNTAVPCR